jgi:flagellar protein FliS
MHTNLAYNAYTQNNIGVESPEKLIQMMYEGVLRFNMQAKRSANENNIERRTYWINRSSAVITELINTLDYTQGEIAHYLSGLYSYQLRLLVEANIYNDSTKIDEVSQVMKGLLEAWKESIHVAHQN